MKKIQFLLNILYPEVCFWCNNITKENPCKKCQIELNNITKFNVQYKKEGFEHVYLLLYKEKARSKILDYKFNEKNYMYSGFANLLLKNKKVYRFLENYDIIIPIPIHKARCKKRGYNQSELIAKKVAESFEHLKFEKNILIKQENNKPQSTLNRKMREENVKDVYKIKNIEKIINKKIILFDDIYTTGSTAKECIRILKKEGAKKVDILTIAKD